MLAPDLGFHGDLRVAASDSCRILPALLGDLIERAAVAIESRALSRVLLPANDDDLGVLRIDFYQARFAAASLAGDQHAARPTEEVRNDIARLAAVHQTTLDKGHRFGRGMFPIRRRLVLLPQSVDCDLSPYHASLCPATCA